MSVDPDNLLPDQSRLKFQQLLQEYDRVFDPKITGYNGAADPIQATVNIGPVQPPQRKGHIPQYSRNQLVEPQAMFDELEQAKVFRRPEDLSITVEYLNPSFLVKKLSGGHRLVTAFADVSYLLDCHYKERTLQIWDKYRQWLHLLWWARLYKSYLYWLRIYKSLHMQSH